MVAWFPVQSCFLLIQRFGRYGRLAEHIQESLLLVPALCCSPLLKFLHGSFGGGVDALLGGLSNHSRRPPPGVSQKYIYQIYSAGGTGNEEYSCGLKLYDGTSMSTAVAAGAAAMVSHRPRLTRSRSCLVSFTPAQRIETTYAPCQHTARSPPD